MNANLVTIAEDAVLGKHVRCVSDVRVGAVLFLVPWKDVISSREAEAWLSSLLPSPRLRDHVSVGVVREVVLAFFVLLQSADPRAIWALQTAHDCTLAMPLCCCTPDEFRAVVQESQPGICDGFERDYQSVKGAFDSVMVLLRERGTSCTPLPQWCDFSLVLCWIRSRWLEVQNEHECLIVPGVDKMNHDIDSTVQPAIDYGENVKIVASNRLRTGQEVCLNYSCGGDEHFFFRYGFVPHTNPNASFSVCVPHVPQSVANERGVPLTAAHLQQHYCLNLQHMEKTVKSGAATPLDLLPVMARVAILLHVLECHNVPKEAEKEAEEADLLCVWGSHEDWISWSAPFSTYMDEANSLVADAIEQTCSGVRSATVRVKAAHFPTQFDNSLACYLGRIVDSLEQTHRLVLSLVRQSLCEKEEKAA